MDRHIKSFKAFFFFNFMAYGIFVPYLGLFLFNEKLKGIQVAVLLGLHPLIRILSQPLWSFFCDYYQIHRQLLSISLIGLAICAVFFLQEKSFLMWILLIIAFSIFESAHSPLGTSMALDYLHRGNEENEFGKLRLWGSIGFVFASIFIGMFFIDSLIIILPLIYSFTLILTILVVLFLPNNSKKNPIYWNDARKIIKQYPGFSLLLVGTIFIGFEFGISNQYFAIYMDAIHASGILLGISMALMALSEIPLMAYASKLIERFGIKSMLVLGIAIMPIRFILYYFIDEAWLILPVQLLHGFTVMSLSVVIAIYISNLLPPEFSATGQGLYSSSLSGLGMALGLFSAGILYDWIGIKSIWLVCAAFGLIGLGIVYYSFYYFGKSRCID